MELLLAAVPASIASWLASDRKVGGGIWKPIWWSICRAVSSCTSSSLHWWRIGVVVAHRAVKNTTTRIDRTISSEFEFKYWLSQPMKAYFIDSETGVIGLVFGSIWPVICLCRPLPSELVDEPKFIRVVRFIFQIRNNFFLCDRPSFALSCNLSLVWAFDFGVRTCWSSKFLPVVRFALSTEITFSGAIGELFGSWA